MSHRRLPPLLGMLFRTVTTVKRKPAKDLLERDLDYMAQQVVAQAFAKQEVDRTELDFDFDGGGLMEHDLILKRMVRNRKEFKANGFANLRFEFLHQLPSSDE